jgi:hypothetical protein
MGMEGTVFRTGLKGVGTPNSGLLSLHALQTPPLEQTTGHMTPIDADITTKSPLPLDQSPLSLMKPKTKPLFKDTGVASGVMSFRAGLEQLALSSNQTDECFCNALICQQQMTAQRQQARPAPILTDTLPVRLQRLRTSPATLKSTHTLPPSSPSKMTVTSKSARVIPWQT